MTNLDKNVTSADLARVESKVDALSEQITDLIEAWRTAKGIVAFVKWVGGLAFAVSAVIAVIKFGGTPK